MLLRHVAAMYRALVVATKVHMSVRERGRVPSLDAAAVAADDERDRVMPFPKDFVWGVSAASYQIEGAAREGGRTPSVWDTFCERPNAVWSGHTGATACDHFHRYKEDVALMKRLGARGYRLSVAWPRVLPEGTGQVNEEGLGFYDRLVDELLAAGITPYVTLFHWDMPMSLYHRGGWLNRDSSQWFGEYSAVLARRLSDRITHWFTLNEPQVFVNAGHREGRHAPGDRLNRREVLRIAHHVLMAHGRSVLALRASSSGHSKVGYAPVGLVKLPESESAADIDVARAMTFGLKADTFWNNTWWMDPVLLGHYPPEGEQVFEDAFPEIESGDMEVIHQPIDFFGVNVYSGIRVRASQSAPAAASREPNGEAAPIPPGAPITGFDWRVTPDAMYWGPRFFYERYRLPVLITENGVSCRDWVSLDGKVHDPQRIDFMHRHLLELERAIGEGIPVLGYLHWSILDNFEWAEGYKQRFGLVYVDYTTQKRTPKDSFDWYRNVIAMNALPETETPDRF